MRAFQAYGEAGGHAASWDALLDASGDRFVLVGGKGGVGKTTSSAALAVACAERGHNTLIVSTDPAHSLGDALDADLSNGQVRLRRLFSPSAFRNQPRRGISSDRSPFHNHNM